FRGMPFDEPESSAIDQLNKALYQYIKFNN
ncbi:uncharacterized protein METZ01_LOCUS499957, partial [marine metagenome]